jgi:CBS domain-containing protein
MLMLKSLADASLPVPGTDPWFADPADPALTVMTDFRERTSITVPLGATIDAALEHMKHTGVRCAFAVDEGAGSVVGLITAYDITGDALMRYMQTALTPRSQVQVRDLLQPIESWRVADIDDVERATVGDVHRMFEDTRLTHVPVMERDEDGLPRLRGLLSAARVRRLLSRPVGSQSAAVDRDGPRAARSPLAAGAGMLLEPR